MPDQIPDAAVDAIEAYVRHYTRAADALLRSEIEEIAKIAWPHIASAERQRADQAERERDKAQQALIATREMANTANTALRTRLIEALDLDDDGATPLSAYVDRLTAEHNQARAELDAARGHLDLRDSELASANSQRDQARAELVALRMDLTAERAISTQRGTDLADVLAQLAEMERQRDDTHAELTRILPILQTGAAWTSDIGLHDAAHTIASLLAGTGPTGAAEQRADGYRQAAHDIADAIRSHFTAPGRGVQQCQRIALHHAAGTGSQTGADTRTQALTEAYWRILRHAEGLRNTGSHQRALEALTADPTDHRKQRRVAIDRSYVRGMESAARDIADMIGVNECDIDEPAGTDSATQPGKDPTWA